MHAADTAGSKSTPAWRGCSLGRSSRQRWRVSSYAINTIALGCGIPAERELMSVTVFRWHWMARLWSVINRGQFAGFTFWSEIERERPALRVIDGGREYVPRGVA